MNLFDTFVGLGEDSPKRAEIALDILVKAKGIDRSKLVRVQRPATRNGKTYMAHYWVTPDKVQKNDTITQNAGKYQEWLKDHPDAPKAKIADKAGQHSGSGKGSAPEKSGSKKPGVNPAEKFKQFEAKKKKEHKAVTPKQKSGDVSKEKPKAAPNPEEKQPGPKETKAPENKEPEKKDPKKVLNNAASKFDKFAAKMKQKHSVVTPKQKPEAAPAKDEQPEKKSAPKAEKKPEAKKTPETKPKAENTYKPDFSSYVNPQPSATTKKITTAKLNSLLSGHLATEVKHFLGKANCILTDAQLKKLNGALQAEKHDVFGKPYDKPGYDLESSSKFMVEAADGISTAPEGLKPKPKPKTNKKPKNAESKPEPKAEQTENSEPEKTDDSPDTGKGYIDDPDKLDAAKLKQLKEILDEDEFKEYLEDSAITHEAAETAIANMEQAEGQAQAAATEAEPEKPTEEPETEPEPKPEPEKPAETPEEKESEPEPEPEKPAEDKKPDTYAEKKEDEPKQADIFTSGICDPDVIHGIYTMGAISKEDNLASTASYNQAIKTMLQIKDVNPAFLTEEKTKQAIAALATQHNEALYGKNVIQKEIEKYKDSESAKFYQPELIAAAVKAWQNGDTAAIRKQSVNHNEAADPVNNLYSKCLTDMVRHSGTVQKGTLYRGMHVPASFVVDAIESGKVDTAGLISTSTDAKTARKYALDTKDGEVSVILELPESLKMKTLEMDGGESLLSAHGNIGVKKVTKDADGIYHVQLKAAGDPLTGHIADDDIYDGLGMVNPLKNKTGTKPDPSDFKAILEKTTGKKSDAYAQYQVNKALTHVFSEYGYDGVVKFVTAYAKQSHFANSKWAKVFAGTKSGYDPALLAMIHRDWTDGQYKEIRKMEKYELDDESTNDDIYNKLCGNALNSLVEKDGTEQPSILHRGIRDNPKDHNFILQYKNAEVGSTVPLGGISSFSTDLKTAKGFAKYDGVVLHLPKKTKTSCVYIEGLGESEYLVQERQHKVVKREMIDGILHLTLDPNI